MYLGIVKPMHFDFVNSRLCFICVPSFCHLSSFIDLLVLYLVFRFWELGLRGDCICFGFLQLPPWRIITWLPLCCVTSVIIVWCISFIDHVLFWRSILSFSYEYNFWLRFASWLCYCGTAWSLWTSMSLIFCNSNTLYKIYSIWES